MKTKINSPEASMAIFLSQDYVQISNFSYRQSCTEVETFRRGKTTNGVIWHVSVGKKIYDEVTDKDVLKRLEKLWDERFWVFDDLRDKLTNKN